MERKIHCGEIVTTWFWKKYFSGGTFFHQFFDFFTFMEVPIVFANLIVYIVVHLLYYSSASESIYIINSQFTKISLIIRGHKYLHYFLKWLQLIFYLTVNSDVTAIFQLDSNPFQITYFSCVSGYTWLPCSSLWLQISTFWSSSVSTNDVWPLPRTSGIQVSWRTQTCTLKVDGTLLFLTTFRSELLAFVVSNCWNF